MSKTIYREELAHLSRLSWPVILSYVGVMLMGIVDSLVVGRYSSLELAGVAAGNSIFWTIVMIGLGFQNAMDPIISQANGAGDSDRSLRCLGTALQASFGFSFLVIPFILLVAYNLEATGATADVSASARPYLMTLSLSLLPLMLANALQRYWQCLELVLPFTIFIFIANGLNLVLNLAFVTGRWGFPALGALGVAIATTVSRFLILALALWLTQREWKKRKIVLAPWATFRRLLATFDRSMHREFLRLGLPSAGHMTLEVTAFSLTTLLMARLGAATLATHHIVLSIASFTFMFPLGVSAATATRVGFHIGRKDPSRAFPTGWLGIIAGVSIMSLSALLFFVLPKSLLSLFTQDEKVIELGVSIMFLCALFQIFDGLQVVSAGALRGLGDTRTPLISNLIAHWFVGLPLGLSLCFVAGKGLWGLWVGLSIGLSLTALINLFVWQRRGRAVARASDL